MCNEDGNEVEERWFGARRDYILYLSDDTLDYLDDLEDWATLGAAGASVMVSGLMAKGVITAGAFSNPVTLVIGGIIGAYWAMINIQNDGCGVEVIAWINPVSPALATPTVHSQ